MNLMLVLADFFGLHMFLLALGFCMIIQYANVKFDRNFVCYFFNSLCKLIFGQYGI